MKEQENEPVNLVVESYQLAGARLMLQRILESYKLMPIWKGKKDDEVYVKAELDMIMSSVDNTRHFLCGDLHIHYRGHKIDKKGKLIKVEAYYAP